MKRSLFCLVLLVAVTVSGALVGCAPRSTPAPTEPTPVRATEQNAGETIELQAGQTLVVELPANPSTGYTWTITALPSIVETTGEPQFSQPSTEPTGIVGAGGTMTYTFLAVASGSGELELGYRRPWEANVAPQKTYSLNLNAK